MSMSPLNPYTLTSRMDRSTGNLRMHQTFFLLLYFLNAGYLIFVVSYHLEACCMESNLSSNEIP